MQQSAGEPKSNATGELPAAGRSRFVFVAIIGGLLLSQFVIGWRTAERLTVTHDEYWHIPVGHLHWKTGRFDVEPLNPPLVRMWAAWPLLIASANAAETAPTSDLGRIGDAFQQVNSQDYHRLIVLARLPIVVLTVAAGLLLACWSWEWYGPWASCLVTWLWSRDPNITAHGSLATTDVGAAAFWIVTLYTAWRFAVKPTPSRALLCGVSLGLAQAAKFTNVLLVPLVVGLWWLERWRNPNAEALNWKGHAERWGVVVLSAWLCLNVCYLLDGFGHSLRSFEFHSQTARAWQQRLEPIASLPVPLPREYVIGFDRQKAIMESRHPVFLDGVWSEEGFPHYYLMTLIYKLPHSTQLLLIVAVCWQLAALWRDRRQVAGSPLRRQIWTLLPAVMLLTVASASGMQLGIRYILPALPLMFLFIGGLAADRHWHWHRQRWGAIGILVLMTIFDPWHVHPDYLAYFNEAAGGPIGGRQHLLDSNLDWGQDLQELKAFLKEHPIPDLHLAYFGTLPPGSLGIRHQLPPSWQPKPGWHAVSVNFVMGRPHGIRDGNGGIRPAGLDEFGYFRAFPIKHSVGASIDVYQLTDEDVRNWHAANAK